MRKLIARKAVTSSDIDDLRETARNVVREMGRDLITEVGTMTKRMLDDLSASNRSLTENIVQ
jgi:hypothetical protein